MDSTTKRLAEREEELAEAEAEAAEAAEAADLPRKASFFSALRTSAGHVNGCMACWNKHVQGLALPLQEVAAPEASYPL